MSLWAEKPTSSIPCALKPYLRLGVGDAACDVVVNMMLDADAQTPSADDSWSERFLETVTCPPKGLVAASGMATAAYAGESVTKFKRKEAILAAGTFFGARLWVSSLLSHISMLHQRQEVEIVVVVTFLMYDETPLRLRGRAQTSKSEAGVVEQPHVESSSSILKLMQHEMVIAISLLDLGTQKRLLLQIPVACHIHHLESTTGENTKASLDVFLFLPKLSDITRLAKHHFHVSTADRASSNDCCEDGMYFASPQVPRLRLSCAPHCTHRPVSCIWVYSDRRFWLHCYEHCAEAGSPCRFLPC